jgi:aminopeptidase N
MADRDILSKQVKPSHYTIDLRNLDLEQWAYDGTVSISVGISEKLKKLTINSNQLKLVNAKIEIGSTIVAESDAFSYDETTQSVCITFNNEVVSTKEANIIITFQGAINDSLSGFYRSSYKPTVDPVTSVPRGADGSCFALSTHFQPSDARRAFPCFDAPNFKATFDLSLEVPIDQVALSNMPVKSTTPTKEGWQVVTFETSPRMSTYLLAWAIGDFGHVEGSTEREYNGKRIPVRIYAVRGIEHQGEFALTVAPKVVDLFSDLFHMPYPLPKMDLLAVPDLALGGMENWGLITVQLAAVSFQLSHCHMV